jgi:peptidoglycan/xylan/chitin deacetylase (PgdA/CDA1 family)
MNRAVALLFCSPCRLPQSVSASAEEQQAQQKQQQCWTPQALAATDAELKHVPSRQSLDLGSLKQVTLAPAKPIAPELRGSIRSVTLSPDQKLIALTFDLCEENGYVSGYDGRVVDLLRAQGVKATFFAGGKWMETHPERAQQLIADPLFEIGSHGMRHVDMSHAKEPTLGEHPHRSRLCPRPECTRLASVFHRRGAATAGTAHAVSLPLRPAVQWDLVTGDPDPRVSPKTIANTILTKAHPGAIVVAHAYGLGRNTAAALAIALPKLKEQGYSFVTVSELLGQQAGDRALLSEQSR